MSFENFLMSNTGKFNYYDIETMRARFNSSGRIPNFEFKSPIVMFIISFLLGFLGVDRFMLGQVGLGIFKLILNLFVIGCIWDIIDWFRIFKLTRDYNFRKFMELS